MRKRRIKTTDGAFLRRIGILEVNGLDRDEESAIFDRATEQLDLFVPLCLKDNYFDEVREFLQPGGQYVKFV